MLMPERSYLGTKLSPEEYYRTKSGSYDNPHSPGIRYVLDRHMHWLQGRVLDLGCGNGLATLILWSYRDSILGVDAEPLMVDRYQRETEHEAVLGHFWDQLPEAKSAVFCYSLHLCPMSRVKMVNYRLCEAGVQRIIVVSPLKARAENWPSFRCVESTTDKVGPDQKNIYGRVYLRED